MSNVSFSSPFKMTAYLDKRRKQRALREFMFLEGKNAAASDIYRRLVYVNVKALLAIQTFRHGPVRLMPIPERNKKLNFVSWSQAMNWEKSKQNDGLIKFNKRTISKLCKRLLLYQGPADYYY